MVGKWSSWAAAVLILATGATARAADIPVPLQTQVEMLAKLVGFDRSFRDRAGGKARVFVVEASGNAESHEAATQMAAALNATTLSGMPVEVETISFKNGPGLAARWREQKPVLVYIAPGLSSAELRSIGTAFDGINVLSATASPKDVQDAAVVSFDVVSDKTKIVVNLPQAQKQGISFSSGLLSIAKVYR
jgi:hypothetical protein